MWRRFPAARSARSIPTAARSRRSAPMGGDIIAPDDLVFDEAGNMFLTEITLGRVCMVAQRTAATGWSMAICRSPTRSPAIRAACSRASAGPARGSWSSTCRPAPQRDLLEDVPMANAFEVGPDGWLYVPIMGTNEIWRIDLATGAARGGRGRSRGARFGQVRQQGPDRHHPGRQRAGAADRPAERRARSARQIAPGLDNCTFVGERLFVSSIYGQINEVLAAGKTALAGARRAAMADGARGGRGWRAVRGRRGLQLPLCR